ncbi:hypothetical protein LA6_003444 [Marinibacterium anthonyi]|nr:hypothetical protein LA6_003444 [Marinibacterium anthonyi]
MTSNLAATLRAAGAFAVANAWDIKGGYFVISTESKLDTELPDYLRREGMLIGIADTGQLRVLADDLSTLNKPSEIAALEAIGATGSTPAKGGPVACIATSPITLSGEQTIDGVLTSASRVLVAGQASAAANGVYISGAGAWARADDVNEAGEFFRTRVSVSGGDEQSGTAWICTSEVTTVGSDPVAFSLYDSLRDTIAAAMALLAAVASSGEAGDLIETEDAKVLTAVERIKVGLVKVSKLFDADQATEDHYRTAGIDNREDGSNAVLTSSHPWIQALAALSIAFADGDDNLGFGLGLNGDTYQNVARILSALRMESFEVGRETSEYAFALEDFLGNLGFAIKRDGTLRIKGKSELGGETDWDFVIADGADNVVFGAKGGKLYAANKPIVPFSEEALDTRNKNFSAAVALTTIDGVQVPTAVYNIIVNWGQSLAAGNQTWPSLSKTPEPGSMMLGDNVDNLSDATTYGVMGVEQLNPLVAYTHNGTTNLDGSGELALSPGAANVGEPPVIGLTNGLKRALNRRALSENDGRNLVAISPAIGGKTIEQLSKGALNTHDAIDRYSILTDGVGRVVTLAAADSCVVSVVNWMQGEYNYRDLGASWDQASYETLLHAMFDNIAADVMALTGQEFGPLFVMYQTTGTWTRDVDSFGNPGLHIAMAQLNVALSRKDTVMAGPAYPYTDRGGHLEPNGSRWFGHQMAKVSRHVLLDGRDFQPIRPLAITARGTDVYVSIHVPVAPLVFDTPYVVTTATDYVARGFKVTSADGLTVYPISSVEIVADTVVKISLANPPAADALVWYADKTVHNGNGNLRDSDPAEAFDTYEYVPERGAYLTDNVAALVDKKYALHNWCVAFCLPITYSEF